MANSQDDKNICPVCMGNGFLLVDSNWNNFFQCEFCLSEGEVSSEELKNIEERKNNGKETTRI